MAWLLLAVAVLRVVGIGWGLPASDAWDNDGVAPRDFLAGLARTFTPGDFYTYPPVHLVLLGLLTLPITIVIAARAPSLSPADLVAKALEVPYMTAIAYVARATSLAMSLAIVWFIGKMAGEIRAHALGVDADADPRARHASLAAAAFAGVNMTLTYYAHTSNLDVPYLFWGTWALYVLVRALARDEPRLLRRAAILTMLAIGTKDQAYALFVLPLPVAITALVAFGRDRNAVIRHAAIALAIGLAVFVVADGVITNPTGFRARLAYLAGSASQDFAHYAPTWRGRLSILEDLARSAPRYYPTVLALVIPAGIALSAVRARAKRAHAAVAFVPLLAAISFIVAFNFVARRSEHRFALPQWTLLAVYGGLAIEPLVFAAKRSARVVAQGAAAIAFALAIFACATVDANLVLDPRYAAEAWLRTNVRAGDVVETYGLNVYMPRMPPQAHVIRVGHEPRDKRSPLPGVEEVEDAFANAPQRTARFVVVSEGWVWRYLLDPEIKLEGGRELPATQLRTGRDLESAHYFQSLVRSEGAFRWVFTGKYESAIFPRLDIHASTSREIWIYERK
jgi:hypothetical protein